MSIGRVPGATGIQPSIVDAKGDLIVATAADSVDRLAVGSNNQTLLADSAQSTGVKWGSSPQSLMTATGDLLYASSANTPARLAIGSTSQVLTVSGGVPAWATPSSGGWTLDSTTTLSGSSTSITLPSGYRMLVIICTNYQSNGTNYPSITLNSDGSTSYRWTGIAINGNAQNTSYYGTDASYINLSNGGAMNTGANSNQFVFEIFNQDSTTAHKNWRMTDMGLSDASTLRASWATGFYRSNNAVTSIQIKAGASTWSAGSVLVYGVK